MCRQTYSSGANSRRWLAFSLVELVIVIAIIGVIGAIAIPNLSQASERTKAAIVAHHLDLVNDAMSAYRLDHGKYPGQAGCDTEVTVGDCFVRQLTTRTLPSGQAYNAALMSYPLGPYLSVGDGGFPRNPFRPSGAPLSIVFIDEDNMDPPVEQNADWWVKYEGNLAQFNIALGDALLPGALAEDRLKTLEALASPDRIVY